MANTKLTAGMIPNGIIVPDHLNSTLDLSGKTVTLAASAKASDYLEYRDEKAANTDGGTATAGSWQTRTMNTENTSGSRVNGRH